MKTFGNLFGHKPAVLSTEEMKQAVEAVRTGKSEFRDIEDALNRYVNSHAEDTDEKLQKLFMAKYIKIKGSMPEEDELRAMVAEYAPWRELLNIKAVPYIKRKVSNMSYEDRIAFVLEDGKLMSRADMKAVAKMAAKLEISNLDAVIEYAGRVRDLELSFEEFVNNRLYTMTAPKQEREARAIRDSAKKREEKLLEIAQLTGLTEKEINDRIDEINDACDVYHINLTSFYNLELESRSLEEIKQIQEKAAAARDLGKKLRIILDDVRNGEVEMAVAAEKLEKMYELCTVFATERMQKNVKEAYSEEEQNNISSDELYRRTVDFQVSKRVLEINVKEYVAFGFAHKEMEDRLSYLASIENIRMVSRITDEEAIALLNDKYMSYRLLEKWYGRKAILIKGRDDYQVYSEFFDSHETFVKKMNSGAFGKAVELIRKENEDMEQLFERLMDELGDTILEEVIVSHPDIARFNPDSVNTIRMITYCAEDKVYIPAVTIRIGMKGSFVDNAGSGGISARVDQDTGIIVTDGYRKDGASFAAHPDTGAVFKGTQLPFWDKALELGRQIASAVPGTCYVGWDLALTEAGEWVVIEGNAVPQMYGIQSTTGTGAWKSFHEMYMKACGENAFEKAYIVPKTNRRNSKIAMLAEKSGLEYEEVYYRWMRAYAYEDLSIAEFVDKENAGA